MGLESELRVAPGKGVKLKDIDPASSPGLKGNGQTAKAKAEELLEKNRERLEKLQYRLWAENERSVLLILQGMDTSGKDGVVRHVAAGLNPEGCRVTSFKKPSEVEVDHDFLWRIHQACPAKGELGVFNRSHYEDVLIVRVHGLVPEKVWKARYEAINAFEATLAAEGTSVLKCFLHISKEEQKRRLIARLEDPEKNWKFNPGDVEERKRWGEYQEAYEDALRKCSTEAAPWYVVPSDQKWYRNWAVSELLVNELERLAPKAPKGSFKASDFKF